jgi:nucleotide-binding universal stress UspA family protein
MAETDQSLGSLKGGRPVVVGYDGKDHSQDALLWAAAEAARLDAPLLVVHAANYPGMKPGPGVPEPEPGALDADDEITAQGVAGARQMYPALRVAGATEVTTPIEALTEASIGAELLVIGTRGFGRVAGALLGSVAFTVPARAACPVIVVTGEAANRLTGPQQRIVVGTDGSPQSAAAVAFAAARAAATGPGWRSSPAGESSCSPTPKRRTHALQLSPSLARRRAGCAIPRQRWLQPRGSRVVPLTASWWQRRRTLTWWWSAPVAMALCGACCWGQSAAQ